MDSSYFPEPQHPHFVSQHFERTVKHLASPLQPLVSMTSGLPHPRFPTSILKYHLLSATDLDALAQHYHQTTCPSQQTHQYPRHVPSWEGDEADLQGKRRRFGRFIGMRGCETPTVVNPGTTEGNWENKETLSQRMEREWVDMIRKSRSDGEEAIRRKTWGFSR